MQYGSFVLHRLQNIKIQSVNRSIVTYRILYFMQSMKSDIKCMKLERPDEK